VVDEKEQLVDLRIEECTIPNWDNEVKNLVMVVKGDEMKLTNPTTAIGGTNYVVLK